MPMPCIGIGSAKHTPGKNHLYGLTDYTPHQPPLVPGILVHCVNELERRGLVEVGLYRVPGSEREVKELKVGIFYNLVTTLFYNLMIYLMFVRLSAPK